MVNSKKYTALNGLFQLSIIVEKQFVQKNCFHLKLPMTRGANRQIPEVFP